YMKPDRLIFDSSRKWLAVPLGLQRLKFFEPHFLKCKRGRAWCIASYGVSGSGAGILPVVIQYWRRCLSRSVFNLINSLLCSHSSFSESEFVIWVCVHWIISSIGSQPGNFSASVTGSSSPYWITKSRLR